MVVILSLWLLRRDSLVEVFKAMEIAGYESPPPPPPPPPPIIEQSGSVYPTERTVCSESLKNNGRLGPDPEGFQQSGIE